MDCHVGESRVHQMRPCIGSVFRMDHVIVGIHIPIAVEALGEPFSTAGESPHYQRNGET